MLSTFTVVLLSCISSKIVHSAFNCPGNGFFADPENCRNYYLCFLGSMYSYTCDETKGFDEVVGDCTTSGCDVKTTTPPPNVRCTDFGEAHPDPSDCTRYYVCYYGIPYSVACGNLLAYNQATQRCERQNFESCLESMIAKEASTTSAVDTTMQDSVRTTQSTNAVDTTAGTTAAIEKTQAVVCPRGLANITDVRDCRMYYTCLLGQEYHMTCPGGTGFNPTTQLCSVDGCLIDRDTPIPTERPHECAIQYGTEEDPVSCLMYVLCFMWTPKRLECDPNTAFNPQTGGCDEASYKPCIEAMTALVSDTTSTPVVTMTTPTVRSQTQGCPWTQPGMFSYVGDAQKYCRCGLGACTVYTCEEGLVFHADQKICGMP
ncbi:chitin-binding domain protein cbd-1-like isoform X2 [Liolophura sinensis]|uniref:chitin-binding domain protein cbd-1-like isoform X2 n=1 Tax=Liolophura sinensis TaxID=3198878 RepID=UPI003158A04C